MGKNKDNTAEIPQENTGAQLFFSQIIELYNSGTNEVIVDYQQKSGVKGKLKLTIEKVDQ